MKRTIRQGVFETNSSSVHVISVSKDQFDKGNFNWFCHFTFGQFGWEHTIYFSTNDKSTYLWTAIVHNFLEWDRANSTYYLDTNNPRYIEIKQKIVDALTSITDEDEELVVSFQETAVDDNTGWGYIDHTPELKFIEDIVFDRDRLLRYLFGNNSRICTWNDNEWSWDESITSPALSEVERVAIRMGDGCLCKDPEYVFIKNN